MSDKEIAVGIDIGATQIKGALVAQEGEILEFVKRDTPQKGPKNIIEEVVDIYRILDENIEEEILGVGIGCPGLVDLNSGFVYTSPNFDNWDEFNISDFLQQRIDKEVVIDNDAHMMVLAESAWGNGEDSDFNIGLTLGTGVGGGIVCNNTVYRGSNGFAGELGHITVDADGPDCKCGSTGCLEAFIGVNYLLEKTEEYLDENPQSILNKWIREEGEELTPILIEDAYDEGDIVGKKVLEYMCHYLGIGIGSFINIFNPDKIIVGGGLSKWGEPLFHKLRGETSKHSMNKIFDNVEIVPAYFKNKAGILGAAYKILKKGERCVK